MNISTPREAPRAPDVPAARSKRKRLTAEQIEDRILDGLGTEEMTSGEIGWKILRSWDSAAERRAALESLVARGFIERLVVSSGQKYGPQEYTVYRIPKPGRR